MLFKSLEYGEKTFARAAFVSVSVHENPCPDFVWMVRKAHWSKELHKKKSSNQQSSNKGHPNLPRNDFSFESHSK